MACDLSPHAPNSLVPMGSGFFVEEGGLNPLLAGRCVLVIGLSGVASPMPFTASFSQAAQSLMSPKVACGPSSAGHLHVLPASHSGL